MTSRRTPRERSPHESSPADAPRQDAPRHDASRQHAERPRHRPHITVHEDRGDPLAPTVGTRSDGRRLDDSMTLLTTMMERPLDGGYEAAAQRRRDAGLPPATSPRGALVVATATVMGLLFALGASALSERQSASSGVRAELVARIEARQSSITDREAQLAAVNNQVRRLEAVELSQAGVPDLTGRVAQLDEAAGAVAMTGPGVVLTLDDAAAVADADAGTRPQGEGFGTGRVSSADLQIIVNGLWGAGAEAISINGHRITSQAAIRFAGQAIIVSFRPLTRPYTITALGDAAQLQERFQPSFAGVYREQLGKQFGIQSSWVSSASLTVPAESGGRVDHAVALTPEGGSTP